MNNYLQQRKSETRSSWCAAGQRFGVTHPGAFFVQPSFVFVTAVYGLIAEQLFISTQWDARRVSAGERFSVFAVLVEQHMCSCQFQGYPAKLVLDWSGTTQISYSLEILLRFQRHYMYLHKCKYCIFTQFALGKTLTYSWIDERKHFQNIQKQWRWKMSWTL